MFFSDYALALPKLVDIRHQEVSIWLRIRDSSKIQYFDEVYEPDHGWKIIEYQVINNQKWGNTTGPSAIKVQKNSKTVSTSEIREYSKNLFNFLGQYKGSQGYENLKICAENEFNSLSNLSSKFSSNNYGLHITASAQSVWNTVIGQRIYSSGGKVDAKIKIKLMYIGSTNYLNSLLNKYRAEASHLRRVPRGLPSGSIMKQCGCWGSNYNSAQELRCASGTVIPRTCSGNFCAPGHRPYSFVCR